MLRARMSGLSFCQMERVLRLRFLLGAALPRAGRRGENPAAVVRPPGQAP